MMKIDPLKIPSSKKIREILSSLTDRSSLTLERRDPSDLTPDPESHLTHTITVRWDGKTLDTSGILRRTDRAGETTFLQEDPPYSPTPTTPEQLEGYLSMMMKARYFPR